MLEKASNMTTKTSLQIIGDFVIHMESSEYCTLGAYVKNPAAGVRPNAGVANLTQPIGYPVKLVGTDWTLLLATDEAAVLGFIMKGDPIVSLAASGTSPTRYQILRRAPAIINQDLIAATDVSAVAFTVATLKSTAKTLGFELRSAPVKTTTQGT